MEGAAVIRFVSIAVAVALWPGLSHAQELLAARPLEQAREAMGAASFRGNVADAFQEFAAGRPYQAYRRAQQILEGSRAADERNAHWIAGLSAWRLQTFDKAASHFSALASAPGTSPHQRSAAAFWAARSFLYDRKPELVDLWLSRAAQSDGTFYGSIAARQLAMIPKLAASPSLHTLYVPNLRPHGGWTVDRALVFAIMRQESAFDRGAISSAGAVGLMQVMPDTARTLVGTARYERDGQTLLFDAGANTALGQRFLELMLGQEHFKGNIVLAIAAYNAGPKSVATWHYRDDPLSFIEAVPIEETRQYIPRVLVNLWMYQWRLNQRATSLDALASNEWPIYQAADLPETMRRGDGSRRKQAAR